MCNADVWKSHSLLCGRNRIQERRSLEPFLSYRHDRRVYRFRKLTKITEETGHPHLPVHRAWNVETCSRILRHFAFVRCLRRLGGQMLLSPNFCIDAIIRSRGIKLTVWICRSRKFYVVHACVTHRRQIYIGFYMCASQLFRLLTRWGPFM